MRRALLALLLTLPCGPAGADVFDDAAGIWGLTDYQPLSCEENPHQVSFSPDHSRAFFVWQGPMINYEGEWDTEGDYDVIEAGADYLVLALDGESRRTHDGKPVVWVMRLLDGGTRYCWGRTDWPKSECIDRYARCPAPAPVS
jgi:hypothetical protein